MAGKDGNIEALVNEILQENEYYFNIKEKQYEIIKLVLDGSDTFTVLTTGYGKSVCYMLPPMMLDKMHCPKQHTSLFNSPLKSLKTDQVKTLKDHNVKAYGIHEGIEKEDIDGPWYAKECCPYDFVFIMGIMSIRLSEEERCWTSGKST